MGSKHNEDGSKIIKFEIPKEEFSNMNNKIFESPNSEWKNFVVNSRRGMTNNYDTVSGAILKNPSQAKKGKEKPKPKLKGQQTAFNTQKQ